MKNAPNTWRIFLFWLEECCSSLNESEEETDEDGAYDEKAYAHHRVPVLGLGQELNLEGKPPAEEKTQRHRNGDHQDGDDGRCP